MPCCALCFKQRDGPCDFNFFKVPKDKRRRKKWGEICRLDFKRKTAWICIDHFLPTEIIQCGHKKVLLPNTVPFIPPVKEPEKIIEATYKSKDLKRRYSEYTNEAPVQYPETAYKSKNLKNQHSEYTKEDPLQCTEAAYKSKAVRNRSSNFTNEIPVRDTFNPNNVNIPKLQENLVMEIPVKKTVFCTRPTQTNTRFCGLIETSDFADDFRINCFYCSYRFAFDEQKDFIKHLKKEHFAKEKAFEVCEYISEEHDYTPTNLQSKSSLQPVFETIGISPESLLPFLGNEEEPTIPVNPTFLYTTDENMILPDSLPVLDQFLADERKPLAVMNQQEYPQNHLENGILNPSFCYEQDNKQFSLNLDLVSTKTSLPVSGLKSKITTANKTTQLISGRQLPIQNKSSKQLKNLSKQTPRKNLICRFLKRTIKTESELGLEANYSSGSKKIAPQSSPVISYEYSPGAIVELLLDSMKNYPVLWQFNIEPFNDNFSKAIIELCKIINEKMSLHFDLLTMRRSINRVLRFYCYLFPNENIENIHPFSNYYDKCAEFLPSSVNEIAYSRCYNCFICFKNDFDLKRHLLKEQSFNLKWSFKCVECKECFKENDEYEFHKRLPHYKEIFRCEPCNKRFTRRNVYNKHNSEYHQEENKGRYKCDQCDKAYRTYGSLKGHKLYHGERMHKCHLCSKTYHEKAKLDLHLKIHRKEYDFICEVCAKPFITQSALRTHMQKHTGEKTNCKVCNLTLRKSSLSRHMRLLHSDQRLTGKLKKYKWLIRTQPFARRKEHERRKYQCKVCMIHFESYKPLAEHNKELHSDLPKWPCQLCSTIFSRKENLKRHYRKKHNLHVIQVYKLVEEGEHLNDVLSMEMEVLDRIFEASCPSKNNTSNAKIRAPEVKSEFLSDEEEENMKSFAIQEEILKAADNITKEEIKIDYMSDFLTEMLK